MVIASFSDIILVLSGDVAITSFRIMLMVYIRGLQSDPGGGSESRTTDLN